MSELDSEPVVFQGTELLVSGREFSADDNLLSVAIATTMRLFGLLWIDEDRGDSRAADNSSDFGAGADCETAGL